MKFPMISDIATKKVASVDITSSVSQALDIMLDANHRNIIVLDGNEFRVLTVVNVLSILENNTTLDIKLSELKLSKIPTINKNKNILDTLEYLANPLEYICVLNDDNSLYGLITHTDITTNIDPDTLMNSYRLIDILIQDRRMKWVNANIITSALLKDMLNGVFDNVIVVENMKPIGILTTKDVMYLIKRESNLELPISKYMSSPVETIHKDSSIKDALEFINKKHYKRVVVVDDEFKLCGIITQKELISLTYSRWAILMKEYQEELSEINHLLENKNKEYETLASVDPLTGLYNRYKFSELYLSSYTSMIQRHNEMCIILLDIDFFKIVNDTYGHNLGDQVLIQISNALMKNLRNIDIICRWGGEEFLVLLPTASLENASTLAEKLRKYIENLEIDTAGKITASFGISQVREGESMEDAIDRADKALYLAKNSGRNCVKTELNHQS
jgi:diguanylate cyclase (GGDEF)-like protein